MPKASLVREFLIVNRKGLHARATAKFVQCVEQFDAPRSRVSRCGETVGGTSIMGISDARRRPRLDHHVAAKGPDADDVLDAVAKLDRQPFRRRRVMRSSPALIV